MLSRLKIDAHSMVHLALAVEYVSECGVHRDVHYFEKFNVWRDGDLLPPMMLQQLMGKQAGYRETFEFAPAELVAAADADLLQRIPRGDFNPHVRNRRYLEPRAGRFYPRGWFAGSGDHLRDNMSPARLLQLDNEQISVDFNHPLADRPLNIHIEVFAVTENLSERGGRCRDSMAELLAGPGMNLRYWQQPTDFFCRHALRRDDEIPDGVFYSRPRLVNHLDDTAQQQLQNLYRALLPANATVLDLMTSINSHLPADLHASRVTGLGMNQQELQANPRLDQRILHDLNHDPVLPFDSDSFDVILCSLSVEYLTRPLAVFREAARVLKPGGVFVNSFSNRWFPGKAIRLWSELHEFERIGLVSEYFYRSEQFSSVNSRSLRGLLRPEHDSHQLPYSDPVYAVWGMTS